MPLTLNWREIESVVAQLKPELTDLFVERLIIPERPRLPTGYLKGEFALRLHSRRAEKTLIFSVRSRNPYFYILDGKGPKLAQNATQSAFALALTKHIKGAKILGIEALPRERIVAIWLSSESGSKSQVPYGIVLALIPALPEALLVKKTEPLRWQVLARSRVADLGASETFYIPPNGAQAPLDLKIRDEFTRSPEILAQTIESELNQEAFASRAKLLERGLKDLIKSLEDGVRTSKAAIQEAEKEPDWRRFGDLLKAQLSHPPELTGGKKPVRVVEDYETGERVEIPCDPRLSASEQVEKFYQLSKRKARRKSEAQSRWENHSSALAARKSAIEKLQALDPKSTPWSDLEKLERALGQPATTTKSSGLEKRRGPGWTGKSFISKDKLVIWVGRSKDENLELTFKHAKGNDIWMHVRGRPGAHVVIPVPSGKSVPLETLLDGAVLAIYYSGGESWGKTEVDYTFKKYVKRIKDSTEASYTNNKTLILEPESQRLKRLMNDTP